MTKKLSFSDRRAALEAIGSDAEQIATDLLKYARIFEEHAETISREVELMRKAEERFAQRPKPQKATREGRPLPTSSS